MAFRARVLLADVGACHWSSWFYDKIPDMLICSCLCCFLYVLCYSGRIVRERLYLCLVDNRNAEVMDWEWTTLRFAVDHSPITSLRNDKAPNNALLMMWWWPVCLIEKIFRECWGEAGLCLSFSCFAYHRIVKINALKFLSSSCPPLLQVVQYEGQDRNPEMRRVLLTHEVTCRWIGKCKSCAACFQISVACCVQVLTFKKFASGLLPLKFPFSSI